MKSFKRLDFKMLPIIQKGSDGYKEVQNGPNVYVWWNKKDLKNDR